jgi:hypothetical protein
VAEVETRWSQLGALSAWQWRVLLTSPWVLLTTRMRLRRRGFRATLAGTRPATLSDLDEEARLAMARETAYAVAVAVKFGPWRPRCLLRSVALARFLGRKGIPCELRIGLPAGQSALTSGGKLDFTAHAWVECGGVVLNDHEDVAAEFTPFEIESGGA